MSVNNTFCQLLYNNVETSDVVVICASITTCHGQPLHWVSELDIWGYSLFHRGLSNVHLCMLNVLSTPRRMVYLESS